MSVRLVSHLPGPADKTLGRSTTEALPTLVRSRPRSPLILQVWGRGLFLFLLVLENRRSHAVSLKWMLLVELRFMQPRIWRLPSSSRLWRANRISPLYRAWYLPIRGAAPLRILVGPTPLLFG
jgi:hypothetical protein